MYFVFSIPSSLSPEFYIVLVPISLCNICSTWFKEIHFFQKTYLLLLFAKCLHFSLLISSLQEYLHHLTQSRHSFFSDKRSISQWDDSFLFWIKRTMYGSRHRSPENSMIFFGETKRLFGNIVLRIRWYSSKKQINRM